MSVLSLVVLGLGCVVPDAPRLVGEPDALDFGEVAPGQAVTSRVRIRNEGTAVAEIASMYLAGRDASAWEVEEDTTDLFPDANATIAVTFAPMEAGEFAARLEVGSDDPAGPLRIALTGRGSDGGTTQTPGESPDLGEGVIDRDGDGYSPSEGDCDDADAGVYVGAPETCDGVDEDCSGVADDLDADGDGHSPCGAAPDCDDADPDAHPIVVTVDGDDAGDGTEASPLATLGAALDALDPGCRTIGLGPGTWRVSERIATDVTILGTGEEAADVVITPPTGERAFEVAGEGELTLVDLTLSGARLGEEADDDHGEGDGGALFVEGGSARLDGVRLIGNAAEEDGGAIALAGGSLTLEGCVFQGNTARNDGGALYAWEADVTDLGSTWIDGSAENGGALLVQRTTLTVDGSSFRGNSASSAGGAIFVREGDDLLVEGATFVKNDAGWRGGAIALDDVDGGVLRNLVVTANRAGAEGGGLAFEGSGVIVANNTVVANAADGEGGGIYAEAAWGGGPWIWSNVVAWNDGKSGLWAAAGASVAYTLAWGSEGDDLVIDGADAGDNEVRDPVFTAFTDDGDPTGDDLRLDAGSPGIDSGPAEGEGPGGYAWTDTDGTRNDRGFEGGRGG